MPYLLLQCLVSDFPRFGKCLHSPVTTIHYKPISSVTVSPRTGLGDWPSLASPISHGLRWAKVYQTVTSVPLVRFLHQSSAKNVVLTLSPIWISHHFLILQLCTGLDARCVFSWPTTFPHSLYFISASELSSVFAWPLSLLLYICWVCVVLSEVEVLFSCPHEPQRCADRTDHFLTTAC